jgi:hypothetical protein
MARNAVGRFGDEIDEKLELFQEWWRGASKELPSASELRSYLPRRKQKRSFALPIALAIGGLAVVGAITLLSTTPVRRFKNVGRVVSTRSATNKDGIDQKLPSSSSPSMSTDGEKTKK